MQTPWEIPSTQPMAVQTLQHLSFPDEHLLDYYDQSLLSAFQQVEELKRIAKSRKTIGSCMLCTASKPSTLSVRRSGDVFKKSRGGGNSSRHGHGRQSSRTVASIQMSEMKEGPSNSDGLMLAVDKFLTAEFR